MKRFEVHMTSQTSRRLSLHISNSVLSFSFRAAESYGFLGLFFFGFDNEKQPSQTPFVPQLTAVADW